AREDPPIRIAGVRPAKCTGSGRDRSSFGSRTYRYNESGPLTCPWFSTALSRDSRAPAMPRSSPGSRDLLKTMSWGLAALLVLGLPVLGLVSWWRGRPERLVAQ